MSSLICWKCHCPLTFEYLQRPSGILFLCEGVRDFIFAHTVEVSVFEVAMIISVLSVDKCLLLLKEVMRATQQEITFVYRSFADN
jgi:hypothetical protein